MWRNEYLTGALELRHGVRDLGAVDLASQDVLDAMTPAMLFDLAGIKLNGPKAWDLSLRIAWTVRTANQENLFGVQVRNGVLIYTPDLAIELADLILTTSKDGLAKLVLGSATLDELQRTGDITVEDGHLAGLAELFELVEQFPFWFNIVTP